ncbi:L-cystine transporter [Bacillus sp. 1P06AnD]|uniref:L-cystine transporter n=1 Tax=Bacillus sp. 1P06AnD TaxID=3132208 RepID=UPI0039A3C136
MDLFSIIIIFILFLALLYFLWRMQKKYISFPKRVFTGLGLGIAFGALLQLLYGSDSDIIQTVTDWFGIVGNGYVRLLKMIVMPLIIVSITSAIANVDSGKNLGKLAGLIIAILVFTTLVAASIGVFSANAFHLNAENIQAGAAEEDRAQELEGQVGTATTSIPKKILDFIPTNPFEDMTGARPTSTLGVVIFSAFIGIASLGVRKKKPEKFDIFKKMVDALYAVVMRVVTLILRLTPFGVLALMTITIATTKVAGIINLSAFVIASYAALIAMIAVHLLLVFFVGLNPLQFLKKAMPALTFAFTSRTSAGTIPINVQVQTKEMGVPEGGANLAATLGASIGQNGCAGIYPAMLAVMIAPTVGIDPLSPGFIIQLVIIVAISSFGVAGVGGGATFAALIVLSAMNLPVGLAGLLISIEPLIDMGRTAVNVSGSMTAGVVSAKLMHDLDVGVFQDSSKKDVGDEV